MSTTAVTKKEEQPKELQVAKAWGTETIDYSDTGKTYLGIVQKPIHGREDVKVGSIIKTNTMEVIGDTKKPVEVIFFKHFKEWIIVNTAGETKERTLYIPEKNAHLKEGPIGSLIDGEECKRLLVHNFFALIVGREHEGPVLISFKKSNKKAAEGLLAHIKAQGQLGKSIASQTYTLSSEYKTFNKFNWFAFKTDVGKNATPEQEEMAKNLYLEISKSFELASSEVDPTVEEVPF